MIKVMVVDDEEIVHLGLQALADWESYGFSLCYDAANGFVALELLEKDREIEIVLLDLQMPKMDGLQFLEEINRIGMREERDLEVIVLSAYDNYDLIRRAFRLGASDYVVKFEMNKDEILNQFESAAKRLAKSNLAQKRGEMGKHDAELGAKGKPGMPSRSISLAKDFIMRNYFDKALSLSMVSSYVGISENHLSSIFTKQTGQTFTEYVTEQRLEKAKMLLKETNLKIYEIAEDVGFANTEYFSKTFKKVTGKSPNQFVSSE
jgi:two-component system response regulator YesN